MRLQDESMVVCGDLTNSFRSPNLLMVGFLDCRYFDCLKAFLGCLEVVLNWGDPTLKELTTPYPKLNPRFFLYNKKYHFMLHLKKKKFLLDLACAYLGLFMAF